jgi:membrane fusion protein (multidrug efflux system)
MTIDWKKAGMVAGAIAIVMIAAYTVYYFWRGQYLHETNDAVIQADQVTISAKLSGYVHDVAVDDNQQVDQGALLAEIDPTDYRTKLAAAEADVASAVAAESAAQAAQAEAVAGVEAARANMRSSQANCDYAMREVARYQPLVEKHVASQATLSQWVAKRDQGTADVAAQRAAVVQAERRVESIVAQLKELGAKVDAARVQRQAAADDLAATRLVAPIAGTVANRTVRAGQFIQPGTRLMTVVPTEVYVVANFKETQVGLMRPGQPAEITVDALPGVTFPGQVISVTPGTGANFSLIPPQNATGNFTKIIQRVPVRIRIDAGPSARRVLVPGLSLDVEVDTHAARAELAKIRNEQAEQEHARK